MSSKNVTSIVKKTTFVAAAILELGGLYFIFRQEQPIPSHAVGALLMAFGALLAAVSTHFREIHVEKIE